MSAIKDVKVWRTPQYVARKEVRVYVHTEDGREGCKYLTGNPWHKQFSIDGNLTEQEWQAAKDLAVWDKCWHTVYPTSTNNNHLDEEEQEAADIAKFNARKAQSFDRCEMVVEETGRV